MLFKKLLLRRQMETLFKFTFFGSTSCIFILAISYIPHNQTLAALFYPRTCITRTLHLTLSEKVLICKCKKKKKKAQIHAYLHQQNENTLSFHALTEHINRPRISGMSFQTPGGTILPLCSHI